MNGVQEPERFEKADQEADEWRAREIANNIAKQRVTKLFYVVLPCSSSRYW